MNEIKPVIAIDGPAASGKGTLARKIAEELGYAHLDTGLLYRAVAWLVLEQAHDPLKAAQTLAINCKMPVSTDTLKQEHITEKASYVASIPEVRTALFDAQQNFARNPGNGFKGAVLDGRDIGTVICPFANAKLFITAVVETRAERRFKELQSKGVSTTYEAVLRDMRERDSRDAARAAAPMKVADDAVKLDTTTLDQRQAFEKALDIVRKKLLA